MTYSLLTVNHNSFPNELDNGQVLFNNHYALIWLDRGTGSYEIDFQRYAFSKSSLVLITQNQNVNFSFEEKSQFTVVTFAPDLVTQTSPAIQKLLSFCIREHFEGKQILRLPEKDLTYLKNIVQQLETALDNWQGALRAQSVYHLLQLLLVYCNDLRQVQSKDQTPPHSNLIKDFTSLVEQDFRNKHKVIHYTDNLNITYNGLLNYTADYCGKTPKEIIVERLLLETKRLLASTDLSVKEIAFQLGFDEPTNMVKYFKKYTGFTPAHFRQKVTS